MHRSSFSLRAGWRRGLWPALAGLLALCCTPFASPAAEPLAFWVLSYNAHGLPAWIARDAPAERFAQIVKLAATYDIALLQENFVDSDFAILAAGLPGRFLERGNGSRGGWMGMLSMLCGSCGSGLTVAVAPHLPAQLLDRGAYDSCAGWVSGANDCWASKGYLATRVTLPNGASIDVYDLHLDAGLGPADHAVRTQQIEVLRSHIQRLSDGRAVIVGGDFNLDARTPRDRILLDRFATDLHLSHSGAGGSALHWTEQIDHVYYRSGAGTTLQVLNAGEGKEFVGHDKKPLSDHPAIVVRFEARVETN